MIQSQSGGWRRVCATVLMTLLICTLGAPLFSLRAEAAWNFPSTELTAGAGIVMDADTSGILFQKNMHEKLPPASITKVLTALVVLENCDLDEKVTFSHDDVYNVDSGSSNAQIEEGDVLTVRDCLYALLLKSANECANALACHVAGSREGFADLMNAEAARLGCQDSHFSNPSGLYAEDHYTSAYDMALIGAAAMENPDFLEIESHSSYKLPATTRNPGGKTVYMEHKMLRSDTAYYDARVVAGKTGYTKLAGNTLITMAEQDGRKLVAVVLQDKNPAHYIDTKALLDLGFNQTENQPVSDALFNQEELRNRFVADTIVDDKCRTSDIHVEGDVLLSLPKGASQDGITYKLNYNLPSGVSAQTIAQIEYLADGMPVGRYFIQKEPTIEVILHETPTSTKVAVATSVSVLTIVAVMAFFILGSGTAVGLKNVHDDRKLSRRMHEKRAKRLEEMEMSEEEFLALVERRRARKEQRGADGQNIRGSEAAQVDRTRSSHGSATAQGELLAARTEATHLRTKQLNRIHEEDAALRSELHTAQQDRQTDAVPHRAQRGRSRGRNTSADTRRRHL